MAKKKRNPKTIKWKYRCNTRCYWNSREWLENEPFETGSEDEAKSVPGYFDLVEEITDKPEEPVEEPEPPEDPFDDAPPV